MTSETKKDYDYLHKIVLIGDSAVGKTSLLQRFAEQQYIDSHIATIGVDFKLRTIQVNNTRVKLQVWDTAGQEKFRVITKAYYRNAAGIIIVYDITNSESFVNTKRWMDEVKENCGDNVAMLLVGNKCDSPNRVIELQDQENYAKAIDVPFFEASAKDNINIDEIFIKLTSMILDRQARANATTQNTQGNSNNHNNMTNSKSKETISLKNNNSSKKPKPKCC